MSNDTTRSAHAPTFPPHKQRPALVIWFCVFATLRVINIALGDWLRS